MKKGGFLGGGGGRVLHVSPVGEERKGLRNSRKKVTGVVRKGRRGNFCFFINRRSKRKKGRVA